MAAFLSTSAAMLRASAMSTTLQRLPVCSDDSRANATAGRTAARNFGRVGMASRWSAANDRGINLKLIFFETGEVPCYTTGTIMSSVIRRFDHGAGECVDR